MRSTIALGTAAFAAALTAWFWPKAREVRSSVALERSRATMVFSKVAAAGLPAMLSTS
jgi:hypothetical protein